MNRFFTAILGTLAAFLCSPVWAAWSYVGAGTVVSDADPRAGSGGITIANPSGLTAGDDVIIFVTYRRDINAQWTTPSGWTLVANAGTNSESAIFCRQADSTLVSAGSQNLTGSGVGNSMGVMLRLTGGNSNCTPHATAPKGNATAAQDILTNALTISQDNTLVVTAGIFNTNVAASGVNSHPCSATSRVAADDTFGSLHMSIYVGTAVQTTASSCSAGSIDLVSTSTAVSSSFVISLPVAVVAPSFSAGPTKTADGTAGNTYSATPNLGGDSSATLHMGAYKAGQGCPAAANVVAGTGTGFVAHFSKSITGADTISSTGLDYPKHDYCFVLTNSAGNSSVSSAANIAKSPPAGYIYDVLASVSATSWCNSITSPSAAANDIVELTSPTAILAEDVTVDGTCDWTFDNSGARDRICARVYDYSVQDWMSIGTPSAQCSGTRAAIWFNNLAPAVPEPGSAVFFVPLNSPMTPVDLTQYCPDPEGDTVIVTAENLPPGLSVVNDDLQGTATSRGIYTDPLFICTDIAGDSASW